MKRIDLVRTIEALGCVLFVIGGEPAVEVIADVSGRHAGVEQTSAFVIDLLGRFSGVAMHEHCSHLWSLTELRAGHRVSGHRFFDYNN